MVNRSDAAFERWKKEHPLLRADHKEVTPWEEDYRRETAREMMNFDQEQKPWDANFSGGYADIWGNPEEGPHEAEVSLTFSFFSIGIMAYGSVIKMEQRPASFKHNLYYGIERAIDMGASPDIEKVARIDGKLYSLGVEAAAHAPRREANAYGERAYRAEVGNTKDQYAPVFSTSNLD